MAYSITMKEALDQAAEYFTRTDVQIQPSQRMIISVVNYHSKKRDQTATLIETELYFALERQFPNFRLVLQSEAVAGVSSKGAVFVRGTYEQRGKTTILRLQAVKGLFSGEIIDQTSIVFETKKTRRKTLVAVLDIEASSLNEEQRKILSDVFRTALNETGDFDMASSADIDKMNPDEIQKVTGCTRDSCSVVIGEQLGVDRVISSSLRKMSEGYYYVSAKLIDIKDGSILVSRTIKHRGGIETIDTALEELAIQLTGKKQQIVDDSSNEIKASDDSSNTFWHITAVTLTLAAMYKSYDEATGYNELKDRNAVIMEQYPTASASVKNQLNAEFEENQTKMTAHEGNVRIFDGLTVLFVMWEGYLIWSSINGDEQNISRRLDNGYIPRLTVFPKRNSMTAELSWKLKF